MGEQQEIFRWQLRRLWHPRKLLDKPGLIRSLNYSLCKGKMMNKLIASLMTICLAMVAGQTSAADEMKKDTMAKDSMTKDSMTKDGMKKDGMKKMHKPMKKDSMAKDGMKKEDMKKDSMSK